MALKGAVSNSTRDCSRGVQVLFASGADRKGHAISATDSKRHWVIESFFSIPVIENGSELAGKTKI